MTYIVLKAPLNSNQPTNLFISCLQFIATDAQMPQHSSNECRYLSSHSQTSCVFNATRVFLISCMILEQVDIDRV